MMRQIRKNMYFFTFNDFSKDGGGTIRMRSIVNALAEEGIHVILISNSITTDKFHQDIEHVFLDYSVSKQQKRLFQFLLSFLSDFIVKILYSKMFKAIEKVFNEHTVDRKLMFFFEYLDNSAGYFFKQSGLIKNYINDVHGIVPLEFKLKKYSNFLDSSVNYIKYLSAKLLDKKVFTNASGFIFVSHAMQDYFYVLYPTITTLQNYILRDGVNKEFCSQKINIKVVKELRSKYKISAESQVIFFAGNFKDLGGVTDLIEAFSLLVSKNRLENLKLLLLGDGERYTDAKNIVKKYRLEDKVVFAGRTKYSELKDYQELSHVIVCPDKQHPFSELVPHIKYFDSLASGKVVINGSFTSVKEINVDEKFSVDFEPSNVTDLANKIEMVLEDLEKFTIKYKENKKIICSEFIYSHYTKVLM